MGQEIVTSQFSAKDFQNFEAQLALETQTLGRWFKEQRFTDGSPMAGFELEAWLIDKSSCHPAPINEEFMRHADGLLVTHELAKFNIELNSKPRPLYGDCLARMHRELRNTYTRANDRAGQLGARLILIGILPTVTDDDLRIRNMSPRRRYRALNEQILVKRGGHPIQLDIRGEEHLRLAHRDVMLESAATAFQIHLQVNLANAVRFYNAARIISAPMIAISANSPFLFGKSLWAETRIPLFEQSIVVPGIRHRGKAAPKRVSFGTGYAHNSLYECFVTNLQQYPVLLPAPLDEEPRFLPHVRLHNGTIWRWNRPLIGFNDSGEPHLRIEHRPVAAGPSAADAIADAAFFYGLIQYLGTHKAVPEKHLAFDQAQHNFYHAARFGLEADIMWMDRRSVPMKTLILEQLIPQARRGLQQLEIDSTSVSRYLGIVEERVKNRCNGAAWQRLWVKKHGFDMAGLTSQYLEHQQTDTPVHEWPR